MAGKAAYLFSAILLLLLASGSWAQDPQVLRALEGQTVSVKCRYNLSYSFNEKFWCKQISEDTCQPLVPGVSTGAEKLRFSIENYPLFSFFTVIMNELKMSNSGVYHCGIVENRRKIAFLGSIHLVVLKASAPHTTTRTTAALASTLSPVTDSSQGNPMWKLIIAGVVVAILLLLGLAILVVLYLRKARGKAQNVENKCHPIYEDFSGQREETTSFNQQGLSNEDAGTICYASLIHLNHVRPQDSIYTNTQPYRKPSPDPLLSVEYASISRNRLGSSKSDA
ncbi:CMRF35-like molecule 7 [Grammomys surdaster]|uniref:CMRF35-like molecule 7 n=1 Tax=Grammomys surdaster TaxID=491861 RepID=UPI00109F61C9|nr:CMRF35-like molecule 7 [Grammomys surdaster]